MKFKKKRIIKLEKYLSGLQPGQSFRAGVEITPELVDALHGIGFSGGIESGTSILPNVVGPVTEYNAHGREVVRDDLPKITKYKSVETTWNDWHGYQHSGTVNRRYRMYPRDLILPPESEIYILDGNGAQYACSTPMSFTDHSEDENLHVINMILEIFGECQILDELINPIATPQIRRLNWVVLPQGDYPWDKAKPHVQEVTKGLPGDVRQVIDHRLEVIGSQEPNFLAIGNGGFSGYFVYGFTSKNLYVLESVHLGNATYIFEGDWEPLSRLTKKDILEGNLHYDRIIHRDSWERKINRLLSN